MMITEVKLISSTTYFAFNSSKVCKKSLLFWVFVSSLHSLVEFFFFCWGVFVFLKFLCV